MIIISKESRIKNESLSVHRERERERDGLKTGKKRHHNREV
jgi:hypothetical protein